jgi:HTH-type transcriptional regulator/antitoxin HipB
MGDLLQRFGENVRRARHARGWTQEDLSAETKLAVVQVSRIERGKREIRLSTLVRLLDGLDVQPETLLDGLLRRGDSPGEQRAHQSCEHHQDE